MEIASEDYVRKIKEADNSKSCDRYYWSADEGGRRNNTRKSTRTITDQYTMKHCQAAELHSIRQWRIREKIIE